MSGSELTKVLIFLGLSLILCFSFLGIPAFLVILFGLFAMKRSQDFSAMEISFKIISGYLKILLFVAIVVSIIALTDDNYLQCYDNRLDCYDGYLDFFTDIEIILFLGVCIVSPTIVYFLYKTALKYLFINPLRNHRDWVEINGIFSNKNNDDGEFDVIKTDKLKPYSVADELQKWAKLRDDGHITNEDFEKIKQKILN